MATLKNILNKKINPPLHANSTDKIRFIFKMSDKKEEKEKKRKRESEEWERKKKEKLEKWLERESDDTSYSSDELVIEQTSYSCPICGNDSYGEPHDDCFSKCANCSYHFASGAVKEFTREGHRWDGEYLCKTCYKECLTEEDELPELQPSDD